MTRMGAGWIAASLWVAAGCYDPQDGSTADVFELSGDDDSAGDCSTCSSEGRENSDATLETCGVPKAAAVFAMKSGDPCNFDGGCSRIDDSSAFTDPYSRDVACIHGVLTVTNTRVMEDDAQTNVLWKDCSALEAGHTGDPCDGTFSCFEASEEDGCLKGAVCRGESYGGGSDNKLLRVLVCDDMGPLTQSAHGVYRNCSDIASAWPLDRCSGKFTCERLQGIPERLFEASAVCSENPDAICPASLFPEQIWCDGEQLHVFPEITTALSWVPLF